MSILGSRNKKRNLLGSGDKDIVFLGERKKSRGKKLRNEKFKKSQERGKKIQPVHWGWGGKPS